MLAENDTTKLLFVPVIHSILLLLLFLFDILITRIGVKILLGCLALDIGVVGELALAAFFTVALLEEKTQYRLRVDTESDLLDLYRLEQLQLVLLGLLLSLLLGLSLFLLGFLLLFAIVFVACCLCVHLLDLSLGGTSLLIFKTELESVVCQLCT